MQQASTPNLMHTYNRHPNSPKRPVYVPHNPRLKKGSKKKKTHTSQADQYFFQNTALSTTKTGKERQTTLIWARSKRG
jgi:hypothetical protein